MNNTKENATIPVRIFGAISYTLLSSMSILMNILLIIIYFYVIF
jgi:hypothetical protein